MNAYKVTSIWGGVCVECRTLDDAIDLCRRWADAITPRGVRPRLYEWCTPTMTMGGVSPLCYWSARQTRQEQDYWPMWREI
jgi:hypothetical protein